MISYQFPSPHTVVVVPILQIEWGSEVLLSDQLDCLNHCLFHAGLVEKLFLVSVNGAKSIACTTNTYQKQWHKLQAIDFAPLTPLVKKLVSSHWLAWFSVVVVACKYDQRSEFSLTMVLPIVLFPKVVVGDMMLL